MFNESIALKVLCIFISDCSLVVFFFYVREMKLGEKKMPYVYVTPFCLWSRMRALSLSLSLSLLMKYFDETVLLKSLD
jgi:hypothetical protein